MCRLQFLEFSSLASLSNGWKWIFHGWKKGEMKKKYFATKCKWKIIPNGNQLVFILYFALKTEKWVKNRGWMILECQSRGTLEATSQCSQTTMFRSIQIWRLLSLACRKWTPFVHSCSSISWALSVCLIVHSHLLFIWWPGSLVTCTEKDNVEKAPLSVTG